MGPLEGVVTGVSGVSCVLGGFRVMCAEFGDPALPGFLRSQKHPGWIFFSPAQAWFPELKGWAACEAWVAPWVLPLPRALSELFAQEAA